jgi:hypothetical protein
VPSLYDIAGEYERILSGAFEAGEDPQELLDTINEVFEMKAEAIVKYARNLDSFSESCRAECDTLHQKAVSAEKHAERLRAYLADTMKRLGRTEAEAGLFKLKFQKSPPSVLVLSAADVPTRFWDHPAPVMNKTRIKEAINAGEDVPGATLTQGETLRIR